MFYTSVCLSVFFWQRLDYSKSCERISTKFSGEVRRGPRNSRLDFDDNADHDPDPRFLDPDGSFPKDSLSTIAIPIYSLE